jgi:hypothetical protein
MRVMGGQTSQNVAAFHSSRLNIRVRWGHMESSICSAADDVSAMVGLSALGR